MRSAIVDNEVNQCDTRSSFVSFIILFDVSKVIDEWEMIAFVDVVSGNVLCNFSVNDRVEEDPGNVDISMDSKRSCKKHRLWSRNDRTNDRDGVGLQSHR